MKFDKISIMIQLLICKEVKHGLPLSKEKEAMAQRYDSGGALSYCWP